MGSFTRLLDDCAKVLEPFLETSRRGSLHWNGFKYAPVTEDKNPDPYALAWWSKLRTTSSLLASQPSLTPEQYSYLQQVLFGTIGSLQDFSVDAKRWGNKAKAANEQLRIILGELYSAFKSLRPIEPNQIRPIDEANSETFREQAGPIAS